MAEGKRPREMERLKLILSMNWKEVLLLQQRLDLLDSLKRQVADSYTLDQRVLYNRFRTKLRRSELTHARLMGRRELAEQLKVNSFSTFNTTLSDGSEAAVRGILQGSAPSRVRHRRLEGAQGRRSGGTAASQAIQGGTDSPHGHMPTQRPHTTTASRSTTLPAKLRPRERPHTTVGQNVERLGAHQGRRVQLEARGTSEPRDSSSSKVIKQESPLHIFLNLGERQVKPSLLDIHACLTREMGLQERTSIFLGQLQSGQPRSPKLGDYYWDRLLAMLSQQASNSSRAQGWAQPHHDTVGWAFVGKELNYRSITFKKLDVAF
ncbi:uncharacterized protein LOC144499850 [Mustelus asterias]